MAENKTLDLAYEAVMASYNHVVDRMNALNTQMDQWLVVSLTLVPLVPLTVLASDQPVKLGWPLFVASLGLGFTAKAYFFARLRGRVVPVSPAVLMGEDWLSLSADDFRSAMIAWRGQHFEAMARDVDWKRRATYVMFGGLAVEVVGLSVWAFQQIG